MCLCVRSRVRQILHATDADVASLRVFSPRGGDGGPGGLGDPRRRPALVLRVAEVRELGGPGLHGRSHVVALAVVEAVRAREAL